MFQTVITVSTVGFGEARPFGSGEKVFTIVLILVGVATAAYTFGVASGQVAALRALAAEADAPRRPLA